MLQGVAVPWMLVIQITVLKMGGGGVFGDSSAAGNCWEKRDNYVAIHPFDDVGRLS
jgi:hypothetical protein